MRLDNGDTKYYITDLKPTRPGETGWWYNFNAHVPNDLECDHCSLQVSQQFIVSDKSKISGDTIRRIPGELTKTVAG